MLQHRDNCPVSKKVYVISLKIKLTIIKLLTRKQGIFLIILLLVKLIQVTTMQLPY